MYIGTYASAEPDVGELRFIARLSKSTLPNGPVQSEVNGGTAIEGSDVFSLDGQTRSKFYSSVGVYSIYFKLSSALNGAFVQVRFIEDQVHGVTGSGVGAYIIVPGTGYETSSGGPFFRGTTPVLERYDTFTHRDDWLQISTTKDPLSKRYIST